jgi:hypothetical protein
MLRQLPIIVVTGLITFVLAGFKLHAAEFTPVTLAPGTIVASLSSGTGRLEGDWLWIGDMSFRAGLSEHFEIGGPLALGVNFINRRDGSGIALTCGVTDLWFTKEGLPVWNPGAVIHAAARAASTALVHFAVDYSWVITGFEGSDALQLIRGSSALEVAMGPYLSWSLGLAYQRSLSGVAASLPDRSGMFGVSRLSIGSVRVTPYEDMPVLAVHICHCLDIIINVRFDINTDINTNDLRLTGGLRFKRVSNKEE